MADRDRAEVCSEGVRSGLFEIDLSTGELYKGGRKVALQEQPFQVLALLVGRPGELVTRLEMQNRLWPGDTYVGFQEGLNTAIRKLRLAFGDSAENPRFIQTVPRRGYRFIAPVDRQKSDRTIAPGLHIVDVSVMPAPILPMSDASMLLPKLSPEQLPKRKGSRLRFLVAGVLLIVATLVWMLRPSLSEKTERGRTRHSNAEL